MLSNLDGDIDAFLLEVTKQFYEYIHQDTFKEDILRRVISSSSRFSIAKDLNNQLERATIEWQENHIENIFDGIIGRQLTQLFSSIQTRISLSRNEMTGLQTRRDVDYRIMSVFAPSGTILVSSIVLSRLLVSPGLAGFAVFGLAFTGFAVFKKMGDFPTLCEKIFKSRINALTKEIIRAGFQERYPDLVENMIKKLLDGDLENEINNMERNVDSMQKQHRDFISMIAVLQSLRDKVYRRQAHLTRIEKIQINLD